MLILRLLSCPDCAIESAQATLIGGGQKVQRILSWPEERTANYNQNGLERLELLCHCGSQHVSEEELLNSLHMILSEHGKAWQCHVPLHF